MTANKDLDLPDRFKVKVKPNASKSGIIGWAGNILKIDIAAPPDKNKANIELLKLLRKETGRKARIVGSTKTREKRIILDD